MRGWCFPWRARHACGLPAALREGESGKPSKAAGGGVTLSAVLSVAAARGSWSLHAALMNATAQATFSNPVSLSALREPWRRTALRNFLYKFFDPIFPVQATDYSISYFMVLVLLAAGFALLCYLTKNAQEQKGLRRLTAVAFTAVGVYIAGMGVTYGFKFYEDEAVRLGSFTRYINIPVEMLFFILFACCLAMRGPCWENGLPRRATAAALAAFALFAPWNSLLNSVTRLHAQAAAQYQEEYIEMAGRVEALCPGGTERVYVVASDSGGIEQVILRYRLRPIEVNADAWDVFIDGREEDRFTSRRTFEEFAECVIYGYDYLVLYKTTDAFEKDYGALFAEPEKMADRQLYRVDKEAKKLVLIE